MDLLLRDILKVLSKIRVPVDLGKSRILTEVEKELITLENNAS